MQEDKICNKEINNSDDSEKGDLLKGEVFVKKVELEELIPELNHTEKMDLTFLSEISVALRLEIGHTKMKIRDVLELGPGSVVQLDKLPDEPVELFIGGKNLGQGEVVVVGERLGIRITELTFSSEDKA